MFVAELFNCEKTSLEVSLSTGYRPERSKLTEKGKGCDKIEECESLLIKEKDRNNLRADLL